MRTMRKVRKDSILHGLPSAQRAQVDKWLFDKGMTYEVVAEACGRWFGVKVSKSSVGRYYERQMSRRAGKVSGGAGARPRGRDEAMDAGEEVGGWAREMCIGMLEGRGKAEMEEVYQKTLKWMANWALEELKWPEPEDADVKLALRVLRILIAARLETHDAARVRLQWDRWETKAARECLKHLRFTNSDLRAGGRGTGECCPGSRKRRVLCVTTET